MGDLLTFELHVDADVIANDVPSQRVLELVITAPPVINPAKRLPLNLGLVIDRSGSMSGEKFEYVKLAAMHVLDFLQEGDRAAVVAYDTEVTLISESKYVNLENRASLKAAIKSMRIGSSTNLSGGWLLGCQEVAKGLSEGGVNRVLLLTDGLANVGITDLEELGMHAAQLLLRGVSTTTFGVGEGFNEYLLEHMANQGGGKFYYIESPQRIPFIFQQEFQEMLAITAKNIEVALEIPAGVAAQVLGNWRNENNNNLLHIWLGDLPASQKREVYVKLLTPPAIGQDRLTLNAKLVAKDESNGLILQQSAVSFRYVTQNEVQATPLRQDL
ncbi:MAG: VWA domain-containing protein, partial [Anaerolineaceae bacterium]|nr:VWA domain-containing protein [Anaerolineaceae bacterium]